MLIVQFADFEVRVHLYRVGWVDLCDYLHFSPEVVKIICFDLLFLATEGKVQANFEWRKSK